MNPGRALLYAFCLLVVVFILAPIVVVIGTSFAVSPIYEFPPQELSLKWYQNLKNVPVGLLHDVADARDRISRNVLMK